MSDNRSWDPVLLAADERIELAHDNLSAAKLELENALDFRRRLLEKS